MAAVLDRIFQTIAEEIAAKPGQVKVAVELLDEGATVPFIARYRKEATGGLTTPSSAGSKSASSICANSKRAAPRFSSRFAVKAN